ncbi:hypothetical protein CHH27_13280 [Labrenzia sp. VG12]|nr:hypothetical protein CHH27_13280 [Labrenzia sp. VG12]
MKITVPCFDTFKVELHDETGSLDLEAKQVLEASLPLCSADHLRETRHIFACCRDFHTSAECEDG